MVDYTGQRFGTVLVKQQLTKGSWLCKCDCGREFVQATNRLARGKIATCGRLHTYDYLYLGKKYNKLTIVEHLADGTWKCICDCGNTYISKQISLVVCGIVKSCGCTLCDSAKNRRVSISGQRFGELTAVAFDHMDHHSSYWLFKCDCGREKVMQVKSVKWNLKKNGNVTCGASVHRVQSNFVDLTGKQIGELTVLEHLTKYSGRSYWKCQCSCGKELEIAAYYLTHGQKSCGHLATEKHAPNYKDRTGEIHGYLKLLYSYKSYPHTMWHCLCTKCGKEIDVSVSSLNSGTGSCGCANGSFIESKINGWLSSINPSIRFIHAYRVLHMSNNTNLEIDLYCKELNLGIEYNGSVYHASLNSLYKDKPKNYHRDKFLQAKKQGIHLINIFDVDWMHNQEKIKMYLKDLIVPPIKLYARNCRIEKIPKQEASEFFDSYHLQGKTNNSSINYGLYYNNELMSVMGFGNVRYHKKSNEYELYRYCVKSGYTVLGGAQRLLRHFELDYSPKRIVSYSDNDYFQGDIYPQLGFVFIKQCPLDYFWFYKNQEVKREACQVKKLKIKYPVLYEEAQSAKNKEDYIMGSLGAKKVYRTGNTRWEKHYEDKKG